MTGSEISQGSREQVETDADEIEREGIARVIYVVPVAMAVERGAQAGEAESTVELRNGGLDSAGRKFGRMAGGRIRRAWWLT